VESESGTREKCEIGLEHALEPFWKTNHLIRKEIDKIILGKCLKKEKGEHYQKVTCHTTVS
jgi:hypothetical protein